MGMFVREDPGYDESVRQTGFNRYKQLLSIRFGQWWKVNLLTLLLQLFSLLLLLVLCTLYWPQLVLFRQSPGIRLRNCVLFCVKHFWRVMGIGLLQLAYIAVLV